jgi:hypothetical protein
MGGATVQVDAGAVLEEPHRAELHLLLTPRGCVPEHRETVGDRSIEDGEPSTGWSSRSSSTETAQEHWLLTDRGHSHTSESRVPPLRPVVAQPRATTGHAGASMVW